MSGFGDPIGNALLERSVLRIGDVSFDFEIYGKSLQELGEKASAKAKEFYSGHEFVITMSVSEAGGGSYQAMVRTEIR